MGAGRPPKPVDLKKFEGTYRKDRDSGALIFSKLSEVPEPPDTLSERGKNIWTEIIGDLIEVNVLETFDMNQVYQLCQELDTYYMMVDDVKSNGHYSHTEKGVEYVRPAVKIRDKALTNSITLFKELGLSKPMRQKYGNTEKKETKAKGKISIRGLDKK